MIPEVADFKDPTGLRPADRPRTASHFDSIILSRPSNPGGSVGNASGNRSARAAAFVYHCVTARKCPPKDRREKICSHEDVHCCSQFTQTLSLATSSKSLLSRHRTSLKSASRRSGLQPLGIWILWQTLRSKRPLSSFHGHAFNSLMVNACEEAAQECVNAGLKFVTSGEDDRVRVTMAVGSPVRSKRSSIRSCSGDRSCRGCVG